LARGALLALLLFTAFTENIFRIAASEKAGTVVMKVFVIIQFFFNVIAFMAIVITVINLH